jgi:hypothetical protein
MFARLPWRSTTTLLLLLLAAAPASACKTPVFRSALEGSREWKHYPLDLVVFHRSPLDDNQQRWIDTLDALNWRNNGPLNLKLQTVDVNDEIPAALRSLWQAHNKAPLPLAVLRGDDADEDSPAAWTGPLTEASARLLAESPARREIARRILAGQSAVYVLLDSGDKSADDRAEQLLVERLRVAEKEIKLPLDEILPLLRANLPLRLEFSIVRVLRADPAEAVLVGLLLQTDADLAREKGPIVFACFGRGRVHLPLYGSYLTAETIDRGLDYLTAETGHNNPGRDLLFSVDWQAALEADGPLKPEPDPLGELKGPPVAPPASRRSKAPPPARREESPAPDRWQRNLLGAGVAVVGVVVCAAVVLAARGKRRAG